LSAKNTKNAESERPENRPDLCRNGGARDEKKTRITPRPLPVRAAHGAHDRVFAALVPSTKHDEAGDDVSSAATRMIKVRNIRTLTFSPLVTFVRAEQRRMFSCCANR